MHPVDRVVLLKALAAVPAQHRPAMAAALGCTRLSLNIEFEESNKGQTPPSTENEKTLLAPLKTVKLQPAYWVVTETSNIEQVEPEYSTIKPQAHEIEPETRPAIPPPVQCLPRSTWRSLWDELLCQSKPGRELDLTVAVSHLSKNKPVERLPRRLVQQTAGQFVIVLDTDAAVQIAWPLYAELIQSLSELVALDEIVVVTLNSYGNCHDAYTGYPADLNSVCRGARVVAIGAFGTLDSASGDQAPIAWLSAIHKIEEVAEQLRLCSPCPISIDGITVMPLESRRSTWGFDLLIQLLCRCWMLDKKMLWHLRGMHPEISIHDILSAINHPAVEDHGPYLSLSTDAIKNYLSDTVLSVEADKIVKQLRPYLWRTERQAGLLQVGLDQANQLSVDDIPWLEQLATQSLDSGSDKQGGMAEGVIKSLLPLFRQYAHKKQDRRWRGLLNAAQEVALKSGEVLPIGPLNLQGEKLLGCIKQRGSRLVLIPSDHFETGLLNVSEQCFSENSGKILTEEWSDTRESIALIDNGVRYGMSKLKKPLWAERFWSDNSHLFATPDNGLFLRFVGAAANINTGYWQLDEKRSSHWASQAGVDQYGLWADLRVGEVTQRMRWVSPGSFAMGSPDTEKGRINHESQHSVQLSQGYWLAETTCTNEFWAAIEGAGIQNAPALPKVSLSWNDWQQWLNKLNKVTNGLQFRFPTEAEWEYGCRAGTTTAYWWGENHDEEYIARGELQAELEQPPNLWGLRSMVGNISEWCEDWYGEYPNKDVRDPKGPGSGQSRVLRGGNWFDDERNARSALRYHLSPDFRFGFIGLRLAGGTDPDGVAGSEWATTADRAMRSIDQGGGDGTQAGVAGQE